MNGTAFKIGTFAKGNGAPFAALEFAFGSL